MPTVGLRNVRRATVPFLLNLSLTIGLSNSKMLILNNDDLWWSWRMIVPLTSSASKKEWEEALKAGQMGAGDNKREKGGEWTYSSLFSLLLAVMNLRWKNKPNYAVMMKSTLLDRRSKRGKIPNLVNCFKDRRREGEMCCLLCRVAG